MASRFWLCSFLSAAALLLGASCSRPAASASADSRAPSVLLVTLEPLPLDRVGLYTGRPEQTPVLNRLASEGVSFDDFQAVAPLAQPVHASILSGGYPPEHGLRIPGAQTLEANLSTLAEVLRSGGYRTAAFVASPGLKESGLQRGFERFEQPLEPERPKGATAESLFPRAFEQPRHAGVRRGSLVVDAALAWLPHKRSSSSRTALGRWFSMRRGKKPEGMRPGGPFFAWVQLADGQFRDHPASEQAGSIEDGYDAEVAVMDAQLGRLLAFLEEQGMGDQTLVVVTGVHGIPVGPLALDDAGLELSDATLKVPCILHWPSRVEGGRRIGATLDQTLLAPTILSLVGMDGALPSNVRERALSPEALLGASQIPGGPRYAESMWPQHAYGLPPLKSWADARSRFITGTGFQSRTADSSPEELPPEETGKAILAAIESRFMAQPATEPDPFADAAFELPEEWDRQDFVFLWQQVARRMRTPSASDPTLLQDCRRLVEARPSYIPFLSWQGIAHSLSRQRAEAVEAHRKALERSPARTPHLLSNLGLAYWEKGAVAQAIDLLEDAYLADPDHLVYRDNLAFALLHTGIALSRRQAFNDAMACLTRVLFLQPDNVLAHTTLGGIYHRMGRKDLARASYRKALEIRPGFKLAQIALRSLQEKESP